MVVVSNMVVAPRLRVRQPGQAFNHHFGVRRDVRLIAAVFQALNLFIQDVVRTLVNVETVRGDNTEQRQNDWDHDHNGDDAVNRRLRLGALAGDKTGHLQHQPH